MRARLNTPTYRDSYDHCNTRSNTHSDIAVMGKSPCRLLPAVKPKSRKAIYSKLSLI